MGLPGSGKTTLANELAPLLDAKRLNADEVRKEANDWDFSEEGRKRQSKRMADFALKLKEDGSFVVADFICPTPEARKLFPADFIIWVDTIKEGRFEDTNKMFEEPLEVDYKITEMNDENHEFNSNVPKTIQELLLMQKRNEAETYSNGIKSLADMPYLKNLLEKSKQYIHRSMNKGLEKINENMHLLDDLKIIESRRFNKMKHLNSHLIHEEIEELMKDKFYLENIMSWWKKKASKRYEKLKVEGRFRNKVELWTEDDDIQIIR